MKVTICNDCGLTMHSNVTTCRRCNQKHLASYEIAASDDWVVHKRVNALNPHRAKPRTHPFVAAFVIFVVTAAAGIAYELNVHPGAVVGRTTKSAIAALTPKHKSADGKLTASAAKKRAKSL